MKDLVLGCVQALYEIAYESKCEEIFLDNLKYVSEIIQNNPEYAKILSSPSVSKNDKSKMIDEIFKDKVNVNILNFLKILAKSRNIYVLSKCYGEYKKVYNKKHDIVDVTVITAVRISEEQLQKLRINLRKRLNKEVNIINKIDKTCIGGIKILYNSRLIDLSIKNSIDAIRHSL